ncbi:MAG: hypothetical protein HZC51_03835 [Nitrospirae bacterium]|nr:hypothetical protein [Nitrospirota bacterium]
MRFPVLKGRKFYHPGNYKCGWCKRSKVCEPNSFAALSGGALLMDRQDDSGGPDDAMDAFLELRWHGAHTEDGGIGEDPVMHEGVYIAKDVIGGQYDLLFCSTKCLREFLNHAVDKLEEKVAKKRETK